MAPRKKITGKKTKPRVQPPRAVAKKNEQRRGRKQNPTLKVRKAAQALAGAKPTTSNPSPSPRSKQPERVPQHSFDDLAGMDNIKARIMRKVIGPFSNLRRVQLKQTAPRGVLLVGPPGTGKTALADAIVQELRRKGRGRTVKYYHETCSCLSKYVGESEENLRALFKTAHANGPSVIFLDELDGLARRRSGSDASDTNAPVLSTLLTLIGNATRGRVLLIAATNCVELVDSAVVRKGRFDLKLEIALPNAASRHAILGHYLGKLDHRLEDRVLAAIAHVTEGCSGSDLEVLVQDIHEEAIDRVYPGLGYLTMTDNQLRALTARMNHLDMERDSIPALEALNLDNFDKRSFLARIKKRK